MITFLERLGRDLYDLLWQPSLEMALLAILAVVASRMLHRQAPAIRYILWLGLLIKPVVSLVLASPWTLFTPFLAILGDLSSTVPDAGVPIRAGVNFAPPAATQASLTIVGIGAAVWLLGGTAQITRLRRGARRHTRGSLVAALDRAQGRIHPRQRVEVATSALVSSPVVAGVMRPLIALPTDLARRLSDKQAEQILLHELAHVRRFDNLVLLIHRLVAVVFFFHPAVWLCDRMLRREADQACDDLAVVTTGEPRDYAIGLAELAELLNDKPYQQRRYSIMSGLGTGSSDLAVRIRRALAHRARPANPRAKLVVGLLVICVGVVVLPMTGTAQDGARAQDGGIQAQLEEIGRELRAAVEAGELTAEQARERYEGARVRLGVEDDGEVSPEDGLQRRVIGAAMGTPVDEWSAELMEAIVQAGFDLDEFKTGIRQRQAWAAVEHTEPEEWTAEQVEELVAAGLDPDDVAARLRDRASRESAESDAGARQEGIEFRIREIEQAIADGRLSPEEGRRLIEETRQNATTRERVDDGLREFQRAVIERAMAVALEEWGERLKAAIERAGWDLATFTEAIRRRQAASTDADMSEIIRSLTDASTAIEERSWGQIKRATAEQR